MAIKRIRMGGPQGVRRPYSTMPPTDKPEEQVAQALDHIATVLSSIDHNLEVLVDHLRKQVRAP